MTTAYRLRSFAIPMTCILAFGTCAGTKPGAGRLKECMKSNIADVSAPYKATLARAAAGEN